MTRAELETRIRKFVPQGTEKYVVDLLVTHRVQLKLNKPRSSKYGDYRSPIKGDMHHRITINKDLNPFAFLTTFLHEVAHLTAYEKYRNNIDPHGREWKEEFKLLLHPVVAHHQIPEDIQKALRHYMSDPSASSCSDAGLMKVLALYDKDKKLFLENLEEGSLFKLETGRIFKKGKKLRSWYLCYEQPGNKEYRVSGISKIELVEF